MSKSRNYRGVKWSSGRGRRRMGYGFGLLLGAFCLLAFAINPQVQAVARGPANPGHEPLGCAACHDAAPGTLRQQLQAAVSYIVGRRTQPAVIGHLPVSNATCLDCHSRSDDHHPSYRFLEARFAQARELVGAHECISCHREHSGRRVQGDGRFCVACHEDVELECEPISPTHRELAARGRWDTCLRCHDFHGNHDQVLPERLDEGVELQAVEDYLSDGEAIYGPPRTKAASERSQ